MSSIGETDEWREGSVSDANVRTEAAADPRYTHTGYLRGTLLRSQGGESQKTLQ